MDVTAFSFVRATPRPLFPRVLVFIRTPLSVIIVIGRCIRPVLSLKFAPDMPPCPNAAKTLRQPHTCRILYAYATIDAQRPLPPMTTPRQRASSPFNPNDSGTSRTTGPKHLCYLNLTPRQWRYIKRISEIVLTAAKGVRIQIIKCRTSLHDYVTINTTGPQLAISLNKIQGMQFAVGHG
jgi:hypothetical protein